MTKLDAELRQAPRLLALDHPWYVLATPSELMLLEFVPITDLGWPSEWTPASPLAEWELFLPRTIGGSTGIWNLVDVRPIVGDAAGDDEFRGLYVG